MFLQVFELFVRHLGRNFVRKIFNLFLEFFQFCRPRKVCLDISYRVLDSVEFVGPCKN